MSIRTLISPLAVAAIISFSSGAMAQAMIGEFEIPDASMPSFEQKCQALLAAANRSLTTDEMTDDITTGAVEQGGQTSSPDPAAQENELELLASLTVDQCREAGLLPDDVAQ